MSVKVKESESVKQMLKQRYGMDRAGDFCADGFKGVFSLIMDTGYKTITYSITYFTYFVLEEEGKRKRKIRVFFHFFLDSKLNKWNFKDYTRVRKDIKESEEHQDLKNRVFTQMILWCLSDDNCGAKMDESEENNHATD